MIDRRVPAWRLPTRYQKPRSRPRPPRALKYGDMSNALKPLRDPAPMLAQVLHDWGGHGDLWLFGYGSLIWRPDFDYAERRPARVHGWHRALKMWSRINRGNPNCPGLVCGLAARWQLRRHGLPHSDRCRAARAGPPVGKGNADVGI